jgi:hemerythrin-like domain-containing protein
MLPRDGAQEHCRSCSVPESLDQEVTMPTKTRARSDESGWNANGAGVLIGAAVAGAAVGLAANAGRKLFVQFSSGATGDWFEALKIEHEMTLAIFDKIEATGESDPVARGLLLSKLKYALTKHANQEENVIYPALREAGERQEADHLNSDHGYVKTYLYELEALAKDDPAWIARVRDFRSMIEEHMREEEEEIFPGLHARLSEEKNKEITALMNKEGFKFA